MRKIHKSKPVLALFKGLIPRAHIIESPQPPRGGDTVINIPVGCPKTVCEGDEEARNSAQEHKNLGHQTGRCVAMAIVGEQGTQNLEGQNGPSGEEICQMGRACKSLVHNPLDQSLPVLIPIDYFI